MKEFIITGQPDNNREVIDYTRNKKNRAHMESNADDKPQLYINGHGFLFPFDVLCIQDNGDFTVDKF